MFRNNIKSTLRFVEINSKHSLLQCQYCEGQGHQPLKYESPSWQVRLGKYALAYKDKPCVVCAGKRWLIVDTERAGEAWQVCNYCKPHHGRVLFGSSFQGELIDELPCRECRGAGLLTQTLGIILVSREVEQYLHLVEEPPAHHPATGATVRLKGKFCRFCAFPLPEDSTFCSQCGKKLD
jgi:hypothetical protein